MFARQNGEADVHRKFAGMKIATRCAESFHSIDTAPP